MAYYSIIRETGVGGKTDWAGRLVKHGTGLAGWASRLPGLVG